VRNHYPFKRRTHEEKAKRIVMVGRSLMDARYKNQIVANVFQVREIEHENRNALGAWRLVLGAELAYHLFWRWEEHRYDFWTRG
jgi:hypothetical protein